VNNKLDGVCFSGPGYCQGGGTKTTGEKGTHALVGEDQDDSKTRMCVGHLMICNGSRKNELQMNFTRQGEKYRRSILSFSL
jgi:hypothetical protein